MPITATSVPIGYDATGIAAQIGNLTGPQKWSLASRIGMAEKDTFAILEGSGDDSFVVTKTELSAGEGYVMNMRTTSGFYMEGKRGTATFAANADFEQRKYAQYGVVIGVHRHASSSEEAVEIEFALDREFEDGTALEEGRWMGRRRFENAAMTIRERAPATSRYWANGRSLETLRSTDIFDRNQSIIANGMLGLIGGGKANVASDAAAKRGQTIPRTLALAPSVALTKLKLDAGYQQAVREGTARGMENYLFKSDVVDFDNCIFQEHETFLHDGDGPQGSVFAPMATLGTAVASSTGVGAALTLQFGDKTPGVFYTKWFPGYNYVFQGDSDGSASPTRGDTLAVPNSNGSQYLPTFIHGSAGTTENVATGGEHYLMIINPLTAATDPGKIGYYAYTIGNNGYEIAVTRRLTDSAAGIGVTTLPGSSALGYNGGTGVVTWGSGTYGGVGLTQVHPVGSLVLPCNAKGVPFGYVPVLGAGALYRAYGKHKLKRGYEKEEDGFVSKAFARGYFGHRLRYDRAGRAPGVMLVGCAIGHPSLNLPYVPS